jgi:hypothetical protein
MHPALAERLHFIERVASQPLAGRAYRRRLFGITAAMACAYAVVAAALLLF